MIKFATHILHALQFPCFQFTISAPSEISISFLIASFYLHEKMKNIPKNFICNRSIYLYMSFMLSKQGIIKSRKIPPSCGCIWFFLLLSFPLQTTNFSLLSLCHLIVPFISQLMLFCLSFLSFACEK